MTTLYPEDEARAAAERFRQQHRLGLQPLGDLVALIEQSAGVDVAILDARPDEHGLTMRDPRRDAVFIGLARTRHPMRQRSTLGHELGHVVFGDWTADGSNDWTERSPTEKRADAFARHLLLPLDGLKAFLGDSRVVHLSTLSAVVQRFLVSPQIAAIALDQAGYIDTSIKREWMSVSAPQLAVRFGWSDQYRVLESEADKRRAPQRLLARAIRGYTEGVLSVQTIATLRNITPDNAATELREAGIHPPQHTVPWADADELPDVQIDLGALDDRNAGPSQCSRSGGRRGASESGTGPAFPSGRNGLAKIDARVDPDPPR